MTKNDFIALVASELNVSAAEAGRNVDAIIRSLEKLLAAKDSIVFPGFASIGSKERPARKGRNPRTGEALEIPATYVAYFKASDALKTLLNNGKQTVPQKKLKKKSVA